MSAKVIICARCALELVWDNTLQRFAEINGPHLGIDPEVCMGVGGYDFHIPVEWMQNRSGR